MARRYRDLYYRWEREQWEAGAIDLSEDRTAWPLLDANRRARLIDGLTSLRAAGVRATETMGATIDAAPTEEQQVFLTTRLADVARHTVFLDRYFEEVVGAAARSKPAAEDPAATVGDLLGLGEGLPGLSKGLGAV